MLHSVDQQSSERRQDDAPYSMYSCLSLSRSLRLEKENGEEEDDDDDDEEKRNSSPQVVFLFISHILRFHRCHHLLITSGNRTKDESIYRERACASCECIRSNQARNERRCI